MKRALPALEFVAVIGEKRRTYLFADGSLTVDNVVRVCVRPSGGHRLETKDGRKFIVAPRWHAIEVVAERWSL